MPLWLAGLYCITFFGPLWHAFRGVCRDRDAAWLWHVPASPASFVGTAWGWWTYKTRKSDPKLVANLQVEQTLRNESSKLKAQSSKEIPDTKHQAPTPPADARDESSKFKAQSSKEISSSKPQAPVPPTDAG